MKDLQTARGLTVDYCLLDSAIQVHFSCSREWRQDTYSTVPVYFEDKFFKRYHLKMFCKAWEVYILIFLVEGWKARKTLTSGSGKRWP